jgi:CrcB protein
MRLYLLVFLGSGLGGMFRFLCDNLLYRFVLFKLPVGTFFVNTTGSFLIGLLLTLTFQKFGMEKETFHSLVIVGFLGGYTTFATFSSQMLQMFEIYGFNTGMFHLVTQVLVCLAMVWLGVNLGKQL